MFSGKLKPYWSRLFRIFLVLAVGWTLAAMWLALPRTARAAAAPPFAAPGAFSLSLPGGMIRASRAPNGTVYVSMTEVFSEPPTLPGVVVTATIFYQTTDSATVVLDAVCLPPVTWTVSATAGDNLIYRWDTTGCPGGNVGFRARITDIVGATAEDTDVLPFWPLVPTITLPLRNQQLPTPHPYISWETSGALTYTLQVATDAMFTSLLVSVSLTNTSYIVPAELPPDDYYCRVEARNKNGFQWSAPRHFKVGGVHLMVVAPLDNNLSPLGPDLIEDLRQGTLLNPLLQVTALVDGLGIGNTWIYTIENGLVFTAPVEILGIPQEDEHELDTANWEALKGFLLWARAKYPAQRTMLALLGHGAGPTPDIIFSQSPNPYRKLTFFQADRLPITPINRDNTSMDMTSGTYLSTAALGRALAPVTYSYGPFDLLFFDQCFQANLDVLYQVSGAARYFIASPNYAWAAFPYDRYLPHLTLTEPLSSTAQAIVTEYEAALNEVHPNAIVWLPAETITDTAQAIGALGDVLIQVLDEHRDLILAASLQSEYVDTTLCAGDLKLCPPDQLIDLRSFALNLQTQFTETGHAEVITATNAVLAALNGVHVEWITGSPWIKTERFWDLSQVSLTALAPLTDTLSSEWSWMPSLYTSASMLPAVRTDAYGITSTVIISSPLAFASSSWGDFIRAWYGPLEPRVGNLCFETPPALVISDSIKTSALTLRATSSVVSAGLSWEIGPEMDVEETLVYVTRPGFVMPELLAVVPVTATAYLHYGMLRSGGDEYFVAARDADREIITRSNVVTVDLGIATVTPGYALNDGSGQFTLHTYQPLSQSPLTVTLGMTQVVQAGRIDDHTLLVTAPTGQKLGWYEVFLHTPFGSVYLPHAVQVLLPRSFLPLMMH